MLSYALLSLLLVAEAAGQGFYSNCSRWSLGWEDSAVYPWIMVAECTDERERNRTSFIPLSDCFANREGEIVPERSGGVAYTCARCSTEGSSLTCDCARTANGPISTTTDLNTVMKNVDGIISCHDFLGVEIDSFQSSPA